MLPIVIGERETGAICANLVRSTSYACQRFRLEIFLAIVTLIHHVSVFISYIDVLLFQIIRYFGSFRYIVFTTYLDIVYI